MPSKIITAGIDEVGRGPWAGPVVAAAVILDPTRPIAGIKDSKLLTVKQREILFPIIQNSCLAFAFGRAEVFEIDKFNILEATFLAMQRAFQALKIKPEIALVDGKFAPKLPCRVRPIIGGDNLEPAIGAASILAKVLRDREMIWYDKIYPQYGFAKHKGYGTKQHLEALRKHGPLTIHRRSFRPVKDLA